MKAPEKREAYLFLILMFKLFFFFFLLIDTHPLLAQIKSQCVNLPFNPFSAKAIFSRKKRNFFSFF